MRVGMVGLGNFGTTMANLIAENGHAVLGWEHDPAVIEAVNRGHQNPRYLPGIELHPSLAATSSLRDVFSTSEVLFIALPTVYISRVLEPVRDALPPRVPVVNLAKGFEAKTERTALQVVGDIFPQNQLIMLSGPAIANEIARKMPTAVMIAGKDPDALHRVAGLLENHYFQISVSNDAIGTELGGILKNIYAIGLGIFDGKKITSVNLRSVFLTIALREMTAFGLARGASERTFSFLAGLGDLFATSLSEHSHNRRFGEYLANGVSLVQIEQNMGVLPEGYTTIKVVLSIAEQIGIALPLARDLRRVIGGELSANDFIYSVIAEERMYYEDHPRD